MISSDSHIVEPPDLWERWLEPEFRPYAPKLVKDDEGGDAWLYNDGGAPAPLGLVTVTRDRPREELRWSGARYATINQGNFEAAARVEEMLEDGVVAEVIYSPQRTMRHFMQGTEDALHLAGVRAYNDWLAKDFCAKAPERLIGIAQMPAIGIEAAVAEMRRCKDDGAARRAAVVVAERQPEPVAGRRSVLRRGRGARHADQPAHRPGVAHQGAAEAEDADGGEGGARRGNRRPAGVGALRRRARLDAAAARARSS